MARRTIRAGGLRISSCGLTPLDPRMHRGRPIRLAAGPHRWWLALDRQAGPFGIKLFSIPNGPSRLFPSHPPPVARRNHHRGRRGGRQRRGTLGTVFDEKGTDLMIEVRGLTKRYGEKVAVNDLTFGVEPGKVTGFLGPNGAGKTTTMRLILGLDYPDAGTVSVDGQRYSGLANPMREVGALLDAKAVHGGRSAYNHLLCLAQTNNLPKRRVGEVLELVGLTDVARKRTKGFSLGMSQRLGIAVTLLGDPKILMFDEPVNGVGPAGVLWIRNFMKALAALGRTGC